MHLYNVWLEDDSEYFREITLCHADIVTMSNILARYANNYLNPDGSPKPYPNGKGFYPISVPKLVHVATTISIDDTGVNVFRDPVQWEELKDMRFFKVVE